MERYTMERTCRICKCSRQAIQGYIKAGRIKPFKQPGRTGKYLFSWNDITEILAILKEQDPTSRKWSR
jgi:predicted site-specific integrase-resolvase